ncbi:hypothetical protein C8F04DRAFT_165144 [Mycena alexandri]|uniref:Expansin-like EG45 domain-containing protein n=1 Tax=Mycena alexandri TaxID=1745969 RepID=A0AAD6WWY1_9AGAR|nr:hypothetical protein C8F04DRAFT_165144 [Mycena alexandri]
MLASSSCLLILMSAATAMASTHQARNYHPLAKRADNIFTIGKRGDQYANKQFTWYPSDTGPDACTGQNHQDSDFYVAMASPQFGDNGSACCGKKLAITVNGKTAIASCVDECPATSEQCYAAGQLDFTKGLFEYFAGGDLGAGELYGSWSYTDGNEGPSGGSGGGDGGSDGSGGSGGSSGNHGDGGDAANGGDSGDDTTTTTHQTTTPYPTSSSSKTLSSAKPSSSRKPSSSAKSPSSSAQHSSSAKAFSSTPVESSSSALPTVTQDVANVGSGSGPSGDSDGADKISGGLGTGSGDSSDAASLSFNKVFAPFALVALIAAGAL